jgi:aminoglycoside phosphotransferase (APT) family kinase protein
MLDTRAAVHVALAEGWISSVDVVATGLEVDVIERKNVSYRVSSGGRSLLMKQPRLSGDESVAIEAAAYRLLSGRPGADDSRLRIPALIGFDAHHGLLTVEFLADAANLRDYHRKTRRAPVAIGRALGDALDALHGLRIEGSSFKTKETRAPWALSLAAPPLDMLASESPGTIEIVRWVQDAPALCNALTVLTDRWTNDALCHNDVRLDNVLYAPSRARTGTGRVLLIDWELCGPGWSLWDVACLLASYLEFWALTSSGRTSTIGRPALKPLLRTFWLTYTRGQDTRGVPPPSVETMTKLVVARLLQAALEHSQQSLAPTTESAVLFNLATSFLGRPDECWVHVLGLPLAAATGSIISGGRHLA